MTNHIKIYGITPRKQYVANGTLATYAFPFAIFSADDIEVYLNDTKQSSATYTVTGIKNSDGGSITFATAPAAETIITIVRNLSIERTSDFQEGGALRADTLNDELDYQIACTQQIAENLNRSMVLPPYAADSGLDLTLPTPSAGKAIVWNAEGTNLENSAVEVNALESTLKAYKESAESAATTASTKAGIASDKADIATTKAEIASDKADIATAKAAEAATTLASKANKDMDNLSADGKEQVVYLGLPSNTYVDLTLDTTGTTYTMPANGILYINKAAGSTGLFLEVDKENGQQYVMHAVVTGQQRLNVPVCKNEVVTVKYNLTGTTEAFRFYYAQGEI